MKDSTRGLEFRIEGMDCAEEVATLKRELGPLLGEDRLVFDILNGKMTVRPGAAADSPEQIIAAVKRTGMNAELWAEAGQAEEFARTGGYVAFAFSLALVMIYMVLASQFNSLLQPLVVMVAQPLAIIGGVTALWMFGETLNLFSMIGMILLMGLVAKNSILLIDLTNQYRVKGMAIRDAQDRVFGHQAHEQNHADHRENVERFAEHP